MTLYAKAATTGTIAALLVFIVVAGTLVFGGMAATGGGDMAGVAGVLTPIAEAVLMAALVPAAAGFVAGYAWTVWSDRRRARR